MYLGCYGQEAGELNDDTAVAHALNLDEGALYPIERSTNDAHSSATAEVELFGMEIEQVIIITVADTNELLHLTVGDEDGTIMTIDRTGEVLHNGQLGLELAHQRLRGVHKYQIMDGGHQLTAFVTVASCDKLITHGDKRLDAPSCKPLMSLQLSMVWSTHCIPHLAIGRMMIFGCQSEKVISNNEKRVFSWLLTPNAICLVSADYVVLPVNMFLS